ncbi:MAG: riboflavin synthase [Oscillospiraceae bacterium]|nr:riboflavin synthase [Oscillospiraceae bacterium]
MFTGIIEEIGAVEQIVTGTKSCSLRIRAEKILSDAHIGDSIAVNGVCLTVTDFKAPYFTADVMPETMRRTNLGQLAKGSRVNLERAMQLNGRFGGHIVSGHIDGTGTIVGMIREDNAVWIKISADRSITKYIVEKGSVTLDGISLTAAEAGTENFAVSVIPHTAAQTTLLNHKNGDKINIECDIIGKYIEKFTQNNNEGITEDLLRKYGF